MQIHELNTLSGSLGSSTYLAVDNGTDTGKVAVSKLLEPVSDLKADLNVIDNNKATFDVSNMLQLSNGGVSGGTVGSTLTADDSAYVAARRVRSIISGTSLSAFRDLEVIVDSNLSVTVYYIDGSSIVKKRTFIDPSKGLNVSDDNTENAPLVVIMFSKTDNDVIDASYVKAHATITDSNIWYKPIIDNLVIDNIEIDKYYFELGSLSGTYPYTESASTQRIRSKAFVFLEGTTIKSTTYDFAFCGKSNYFGWSKELYVPRTQVARLLIRKSDNGTIQFTEIATLVADLAISSYDGKRARPLIANTPQIYEDMITIGSLTGTSYPYTESVNSYRARTSEILVEGGTLISTGTSDYDVVICGYYEYHGWAKSVIVQRTQIVRLLFRKHDNSILSDTDIPLIKSALTINSPSTNGNVFEPDYQSEIDSVGEAINMSSVPNRVSYAFITDLHIDQTTDQPAATKRQLASLVDLANHTDVDFVAVGGDLIMGDDSTKATALSKIKTVADVLVDCKKPVFIIKGNHDYNSFQNDNDELIFNNQWYPYAIGVFNENIVHDSTNPSSAYFYYDIPSKKTRCIFLDTSDWGDVVADARLAGQSTLAFGEEQLKWFANEALAISEDGWQYLLFGHVPIDMDYNCWDVIPTNSDVVTGLVKALNERDSYSDEGTGISKDFSAYNSSIKLYHYGHTHCDLAVNDAETGMAYICTRCACCYTRNYTLEELHVDNPAYIPPTAGVFGEVSECAYDLVSVTDTGLTAYRFGTGNDKTLTF